MPLSSPLIAYMYSRVTHAPITASSARIVIAIHKLRWSRAVTKLRVSVSENA